jgi:Protein of unknown function (DUF1360)
MSSPPEPTAGHSDQHRPLLAYGAIAAAFNGLFAAGVLAARRADRLPDRFGAGDVALLAGATAKLSRLLSRDRVTSVIRAPFTSYQDDTGYGEVEESARGTGARRAIGELLICQYCVSQWVAAGFVIGHALAPRETRLVAGTFTVFGLADVMNVAYSAAQSRA